MSQYKRWKGKFDASSLTGTFQDIGDTIDFPSLKMTVTNTSDVGVLITDGSEEDDFEIPGGGSLSIGEVTGDITSRNKYVFTANTQLKVKQVTASGTGNIIIHCFG